MGANGELALIERLSSDDARSQLLLLCVKFLVLQSLRLLSAMLAAAVLRRHLMVWKIFAPRFIFEGIGFGVSAASTVCGYLCLCRCVASVAAFYRASRRKSDDEKDKCNYSSTAIINQSKAS